MYLEGADSGRPAGADDHVDDVAELRARVESLERALDSEREARRRADHIIAALTERIPELEAPPRSAQEAESVAERAGESAGRAETSSASTGAESEASEHPSPWWRRIFGR